MKKMFSFLFATLMTLFASPALAVEVTVIEPDEVYSSIDDLLGAGSFAIVNTTDGKALYGTNNQNLGYGTYEDAFKSTNSGYLWKLVEADEEGNYHLQLITPAGADYNCWGMGGMLNSQGEPQGWACSFILGLNNQKGQDIPNGAVYTLTYTNDGWTIKNVGTGMYQPYSTGPANSTEPTYWQFCSLKENTYDDGTDPVTYEFPASLNSLVENATVFTLKSGDSYVYGTEQQGIAVGSWEDASATTNNANGYILENDENGFAYLRAVKTDGSNISAWGTNPCYLNSQPSISGVTFNMGKDQDFKNGSTWIITEVEGGYTLQNLGNKGYFNGTGMSADPVVWELYVPGEDLDLTISPAFVVEGEEDVVTLNDHSSVSVPSANALKVNFGDNAAVRYATYVINELVEDVDWNGEPYTYEEEVASGTLSINTIGYAEFAEPLTFYYGHKYNIYIKAWDVDENNLFDENFNMAAPIGSFTAEFNGATDETPAGEDLVVTPAFINGEEEVTLNDHASVSVEAAEAIKVAFENAPTITGASYIINEMVQSESEEGTSWVAGEEIAAGTLSMNGIAYAEFANPLTFASGKKYQLSVSVIGQTEELGTYTYEFNGAYVAPEPEQAEIADGVYRIANVEAVKFLSNGAYWGTRAVLAENGISYNVVRNLENGKYTLKSGIKGDAKALRPSDGFNDQSGEWEIYKYDQNGGVVLFNGEKYFSYDGTDIPQFVDEPTDASVWKFVSEDDIKAMVATATRENPMDATVYVKGADFLNGDVANAAWAGNKVGGNVGSGNTLINNTNCEARNKGAFTISQTITDLPNGFYDLTAFGFYREGNRDVASSVDAYENGTENASVLSANDKSVALKSVYSEAKTEAEGGWAVEAAASSAGNVYFIPNSQGEAAACFEAGAYLNEIKNIEVTDGTLTISVSREGEAIFDWTVFDNIRLTYYGTEAPEEQTIEAFLINGEEEIALEPNRSASAEKTEGIKVQFGIPSEVASATYAIMPLVQAETEEGTTWVPGADVKFGDLSINNIAYAEVEYTFEYGTKYQIDINVNFKDGSDTKESFYVDGATEVGPTEPEIIGESLKLMPGGNSTLPIPDDAVRVFTFNNQWSSTAPTVNSFDASIYKEVVIEFKEALPFYYNTPYKNAAGEQQWGGVPAGSTEFRLDLETVGSITDFSIQNTQASETPGNTFAIAKSYAVKQDGSIEPIYFQAPGWGASMSVEADIYSANVSFNGQWANIGIDGLKDVEGKKIVRVYTNTPINPDDVQFCIRTTDGADAWPQILLQDDTKCYGLAEINETLESILLQWKSATPGSMDIVAVTVEVEQEQTIETVLLYGEEQIAINTHSSVSAEQIDGINVQFGIPAAVKSATYSIMPMTLVQNEEGSSWTPNTENATTGDFSINTIANAEVEYIFEQGTKYQIVVKVNFFDGTDATETYEIDGAYVDAEDPEIAIADMKFNVAEDAELDEDGTFKVEFTYSATMNDAASATFPSGMVAYKVTDAEGNVVAETETDFDLSLTSRNIYLKNLEPGKTYTLTATKVYGAGLDMETFESVEIPATITGELPTIEFFVPEVEVEKAVETTLLYGEEEVTLNSHANVSADKIEAIKVNFIGMPDVVSATYTITPMTKAESAEGTSWTPITDKATTGELSINSIGYAEVDYTFDQGTKYQIVVKVTLQDGTEVTETYEVNGSTATYKGYIASTGMLLSTGVSKSFEQAETISVNSKEISFENVFIPVVNIATGDFTIPVTTETDATGTVIYRAQEVDVNLHDVYYSGGQDDAVPFKAWLIGMESTDGPILFVHLQSNLQDIFIAYNALLKDAKWMMSEISPEDVNAGGAKVLNFLEATSINSVATDAKANGKYFENGKVIIVNKDKKYNVNGAIIK